MNNFAAAIRTQIESCRELLNVFQKERQLYNDKDKVGISEVMQILNRKKQIVEIFDKQHRLVKLLQQSATDQSQKDAAEQKTLMRELGSILEQLLVIDHENEKLLRDNITSRKVASRGNVAASTTGGSSAGRARPALQRQLPFVPGGRGVSAFVPNTPMTARRTTRTAPAAATAAAPKKTAATAAAGNDSQIRTAGKHLLRRYAQNSQMLNLASKYA